MSEPNAGPGVAQVEPISTEPSDKQLTEVVSFEWYYGKPWTREFKQTLDVRDFLGTAGYPWLIIAANPHVSLMDLVLYLSFKDGTTPGVERSRSWIQRRRWMFKPPTDGRAKQPTHDPDGRHARALRIMAENTSLSVRQLTRLLKENHIVRSREWVRMHRCDGLTVGK